MITHSRKIFYLLLISGVTVVLALSIAMGVMVRRHLRSSQLFKDGETAFLNGDYETAETALRAYIEKDPNKEEALKYLAEIAEHEGDWWDAATCWNRLSRLNVLNEDYFKNCVNAHYRSHNYHDLDILFRNIPEEKRQDYGELYALTQFKVHPKEEETAALVEALPKDSDTARLIAAITNSGPQSELDYLKSLDDPVMKVEALMIEAYVAELVQKDFTRAEKAFREAVEINQPCCEEELANFLFRRVRYKEALESYKRIKRGIIKKDTILNNAEALFSVNDAKGLEQLEKLVSTSGNTLIAIRAYIQSLHAMLNKDTPRMLQNYNVAVQDRETPIGLLLRYAVAVNKPDINLLHSVISRWQRTAVFKAKQKEILNDVKIVLQKALQQKEWRSAALLASLFADQEPPELIVWHAILLGQNASNTLSASDLNKAIGFFPDDILLRQLALRTAMASGNLTAVMEAYDQLIEKSKDKTTAHYRKVLFLERQNLLDEAFEELGKLVDEEHSLRTAKHCLAFGMRTGNKEALKIAEEYKELAEIAQFENERRYGDIEKAAAFLKEHEIEKALSAKNIEDRELLLPIAIYLGVSRIHERAIAAYTSLKPYMSDTPTLDINISELYADMGKKEQALESAKEALDKFPNSRLAQAIYGIRCAESGDYQKAITLIPDNIEGKYARSLLIASLEKDLESSFKDKRYATCKTDIARLQTLQPDNECAKEHLAKMEALQDESEKQDNK